MSDIVPYGGAELAELMRQRFSGLLKSRIKLSPIYSLRASSIGIECERHLFYEQTEHEKRIPHKEGLQAIFDLGNELEKYVVRLLDDMGFTVEQRNRTFHDRQHNISGHLDGRLRWKDWPLGKTLPIEIKGLNPYTADAVRTLDDIRHSKQKWVRKYYAQLQTYQWLDDDEWGLFVLLNKSTGFIEFIACPIDRPFIAKMLEKADLVRDAVLQNEAPERRRSEECPRCPFVHVCLPDIDYGKGPQVMDHAELIEAIRRREAVRESKREFDAADRAIKAMLPEEPGDLLVGPYLLSGKKVDRDAYSVSAGSYVKWDVELVGPALTSPPLLDPFTGPRYLERVPQTSAQPAMAATEENEFD